MFLCRGIQSVIQCLCVCRPIKLYLTLTGDSVLTCFLVKFLIFKCFKCFLPSQLDSTLTLRFWRNVKLEFSLGCFGSSSDDSITLWRLALRQAAEKTQKQIKISSTWKGMGLAQVNIKVKARQKYSKANEGRNVHISKSFFEPFIWA